MHEWLGHFGKHSLARDVINGKVKPSEFVEQWEVMIGRRWDNHTEYRDQMLMWLAGAVYEELFAYPLAIHANLVDSWCVFPGMGWNYHAARDDKLDFIKPSKVPWWMQQNADYVRELFPKHQFGLSHTAFGIGREGRDVIRFVFSLPYLDKGMLGRLKYKTTQMSIDLVYEPFKTAEMAVPYNEQEYREGAECQLTDKQGKTLALNLSSAIEQNASRVRLPGAGERDTDIYVNLISEERIFENDAGEKCLAIGLTQKELLKSRHEHVAKLRLAAEDEAIGTYRLKLDLRSDQGRLLGFGKGDKIAIRGILDENLYVQLYATPRIK
jgi:hypothetical protein